MPDPAAGVRPAASSPLAGRTGDLAAVGAREVAFLAQVSLRADPALAPRVRFALPLEPNTWRRGGGREALWLGPDEWLVTCPAPEAAGLAGSLRDALAGVHAAITEVTDGRVAFRIAGPSARDVLAKGCPLDLHPRAFPPGSCAQSLLAKADVLIHLLDDDPERCPSFDLYVARSFAHYLWMWLEDAGREYGVQIARPT
jgi:sarcosine oxidase, subunit gamma